MCADYLLGDMKTYLFFAILWILLVWFPAENMRYSFCHYGDNSRLESILREDLANSSPFLDKNAGTIRLQEVIEERHAHLRNIAQDGVAMLAISSIWLCFIRWHRKNPDYFYWRLVHPAYWQLVHCWNIIRLRRGLIIIVVALTAALAALVTFLIYPTYSSTAHIFIRNDW